MARDKRLPQSKKDRKRREQKKMQESRRLDGY
jgi:hypothetical protein